MPNIIRGIKTINYSVATWATFEFESFINFEKVSKNLLHDLC